MFSVGKIILQIGIILVIVGVVLLLLERFDFLRLGRLPGDIRFHRGNLSFSFPLITCLLISIILTLLFSIFRK
jgi:hypothetical protein